jgi:hypothetical protein
MEAIKPMKTALVMPPEKKHDGIHHGARNGVNNINSV